MTKFQQILTDLQAFFSPLRTWIIDKISLITGFSLNFSEKLLLYTFWLVIVVFLFQLIKNKIKKRALTLKKQLIEVYDKILYLVAKAEYIQKQKGSASAENPSLAMLHSLVDSKDNPNYFNSKELFKTNIKKIEQTRGNTLVSEENRKQINHRHESILKINFFAKVILILQILSIIGYIYLLVK